MSSDMKFVNRGPDPTPMELEAGEGKVAVEEAPYTCDDFISSIKNTTREEVRS